MFSLHLLPTYEKVPDARISPKNMSQDTSLLLRRRAPTPAELDAIPWMRLLSPAQYQRAADDLKISEANPGEYVCRVGRPVTYWIGVVDGLLKMSTSDADGKTITYTGVPPVAGLARAPR